MGASYGGPPSAVPPAQPQGPVDKGLKSGALGLVSSTVIGLASTAPAYSLAATLGAILMVAYRYVAPAYFLRRTRTIPVSAAPRDEPGPDGAPPSP